MSHKKIGLTVKNLSLKEHDKIMNNLFQHNIEEKWSINEMAYNVKIKEISSSLIAFYGEFNKNIKITNFKIFSNILTENEIVISLKGEFLKFIFDELKKNPIHQNLIIDTKDFTLKSLNISTTPLNILYLSVFNQKICKINNINYVSIDSRLLSYFKLNHKTINSKTFLTIYVDNNKIYEIIFIEKKGQKRIYGFSKTI